VGRSKPDRARQKSVTPKETGEHCTEIELGCVSILESFFGSFCSQKEQFYPAPSTVCKLHESKNEKNEHNREQFHPVAKTC
jgi:hypothetical protein